MGKEWDTFKPDVLAKNVASSSRKKFHERSKNKRRTGSPAMESARYDHTNSGAKKFREWFTGISVEMLRVLKPGAFAFVCIGARQDSVSAVITAMTEAGFKTDFTSLFWTYASGFPKASNIGKVVDKRNGQANVASRFTEWMRTTGLSASQLNKATGTFMGSHYLTNGSQPALPTPSLRQSLHG